MNHIYVYIHTCIHIYIYIHKYMNSKIIHSCTWVIIQDGDEFAISLLFANDIQKQSATARVNLWGSPFSDTPHLKLWPRIGNPGCFRDPLEDSPIFSMGNTVVSCRSSQVLHESSDLNWRHSSRATNPRRLLAWRCGDESKPMSLPFVGEYMYIYICPSSSDS